MINAKQAREQSTDNFYKSLSADEKVAHFYVEGRIKLAVDNGEMYTVLDYKDEDVPNVVFGLLESQHYVNYLDELGFELRYDNVFGKYTIVW
ncbi:hypothetical protein Ln9_0046 [Leuconostoc phage Ln-9]|uniref:Uncharacterized protein n=1 Tax=Leuconostoc phage Ln-9 TaxID=1536605 RepID=A0A0D3MKD8_9CAUD|nr:hypothetical protein ACQ47_gp46 [Leuconostoc phage Ln-9]AIM50895.1 hypothetical protein Ln9_0046 [Leuconostoc phage Ln-9]